MLPEVQQRTEIMLPCKWILVQRGLVSLCIAEACFLKRIISVLQVHNQHLSVTQA